MAEWLKAAVLKTVSGVTRSGVRIPLPPPSSSQAPEEYPQDFDEFSETFAALFVVADRSPHGWDRG